MRLRNYWKNDDVDVPDEHAMQLLHLYVTLTKQAQVRGRNSQMRVCPHEYGR